MPKPKEILFPELLYMKKIDTSIKGSCLNICICKDPSHKYFPRLKDLKGLNIRLFYKNKKNDIIEYLDEEYERKSKKPSKSFKKEESYDPPDSSEPWKF